MTARRRALLTVCLTVTLERFAFYSLLAMLALYLRDLNFGLGWSPEHTSSVYSAFQSALYGLSILGGLLADRFVGYRRGIILGGCLLAAGQLLLLVPDPYFVYTALVFIATGAGLFRPSMLTQVGQVGGTASALLDMAFLGYMVCVNVGAYSAPLVAELIRQSFGYLPVFAYVGASTAAAILLYVRGFRGMEAATGASDTLAERTALSGCFAAGFRFAAFATPFFLFFAISKGVMEWSRLLLASANDEDIVSGQPTWFGVWSVVSALALFLGMVGFLRRRSLTSNSLSTARLLFGFLILITVGLTILLASAGSQDAILRWKFVGLLVVSLGSMWTTVFAFSLLYQIAEPRWRALSFGLWLALTGFLAKLDITLPEELPPSLIIGLPCVLIVLAFLTYRITSRMTALVVLEPLRDLPTDEP